VLCTWLNAFLSSQDESVRQFLGNGVGCGGGGALCFPRPAGLLAAMHHTTMESQSQMTLKLHDVQQTENAINHGRRGDNSVHHPHHRVTAANRQAPDTTADLPEPPAGGSQGPRSSQTKHSSSRHSAKST
jgi:hypothetical protein